MALFWKQSPTKLFLLLLTLVGLTLALGCAPTATEEETAEPAMTEAEWPSMPNYEAMAIPSDNPMTAAKVELGKQLYYDKRLSGDGSRACYTCHLKENGLTDGRPVAIGAYEKTLTRSAPTMWNVGYYKELYWDGRSGALEKQVKGAWGGGNMGASGNDGAPSMEDICATLNEIEGYKTQFKEVFGSEEGATPDHVAYAVAAFMRTIVANDSAWARYRGGDESALSAEAKEGYELFKGKAKCTNCHDGVLLTDMQYHNVGIGMDAETPDVGRFKVSGDEKDTGAFKTPTLLDIASSGPYFHDGSVETLEEAVELMTKGGIANDYLDKTNLQETMDANLNDDEIGKLVAFLKELDVNYTITEPALP